MNVAGFTVRRPVFTVMMTLIAVTLGLIALYRLPIDLMPDVTYPTLTVRTDYENASPQEMEQLVTRLIEESVAAVPGVEEMASASSEGSSSVRVSFAWGTDLDVATNDIRDRLERILDNLPEGAERPQIRKFDANAFPILIIGVASRMDPIELRAQVGVVAAQAADELVECAQLVGRRRLRRLELVDHFGDTRRRFRDGDGACTQGVGRDDPA